jgi:membrane protein required for colicin V production
MGDLPITLFDIVVVVVIALSALMGLARGLVKEVLGLVSWIGAAIITWYLFEPVRPFVRETVGGDLLADLATGIGLFVLLLVLLKILGSMLAGGIQGIGLGPLDRLAGLLFGTARGIALVCIGWLVASTLIAVDDQPPSWARGALLLPPVERGAEWLEDSLPGAVSASGRAAAARTGDTARQLQTAREALRGPGRADGERPGYTDQQRREMDQLFKPGG